jgi:hypothetical protein
MPCPASLLSTLCVWSLTHSPGWPHPIPALGERKGWLPCIDALRLLSHHDQSAVCLVSHITRRQCWCEGPWLRLRLIKWKCKCKRGGMCRWGGGLFGRALAQSLQS